MTVALHAALPVTVIGGYLGAGKTTLINSLLRQVDGLRLAVLVNDFGAINVDAGLIAAHDGETIELTNGCICCSIVDSLGQSLDAVLAMDPPPDHIVIEASGVADPGTIAAYGQGWPGCRLDAVIVLADAETVQARAQDRFVGELVTRQISRADVVLLTKTDLISAAEAEATATWVRRVTDSPVVAVTAGAVDPGVVLGLGLGQRPIASDVFDSAVLESAKIALENPIDLAALEAALTSWPDEVLRVKGTVLIGEAKEPHLVQRVGRRCTIEPINSLLGGTPALVVIYPCGTIDPNDLSAPLR